MKGTLTLFLILPLLLVGCASPGGHTLLGTVIGSVAGVGMGLVADAGRDGRGRAQNVFAGASIGALLGGTTGYILEQNANKKADATQDAAKLVPATSSQTPPKEPGMPVLVPPKVDGRFIDDQVRGNVFIPGHFEYQIKEPARWRRYEANPDH